VTPATPGDHPHTWAADALRRIRADAAGALPTPLRPVPLPAAEAAGVRLLFKDESALPTGSIKYRHTAALFGHAVVSGLLCAGTPAVVAATGGAVAVAGARLARLLDVPFTAVVPGRTPRATLTRIEEAGGAWRFVQGPPAALDREAREVAERLGGGWVLDPYADAERAVACCGEPTVADELFAQLPDAPAWVVTGAGTGATSAALGRHLRRHGLTGTRLAVVDPENSAFFPAWASGAADFATGLPSRIPGIGRPRTGPGFLPSVLDLVIPVPDAASVAAMRWLRRTAALPAGPASGACLWGACHLMARMIQAGVRGTVVALLGDGAGAYDAWDPHLDAAPHEAVLDRFAGTGAWPTAT
jgi:cysteine synthase A